MDVENTAQQNKGKLVHMSFVVLEDLRNTFKAKVSAKGKNARSFGKFNEGIHKEINCYTKYRLIITL